MHCPGFKSQITRIPNQNFGLAVLSNDESYGGQIVETIKFHIIDKVLNLQTIDWSARYKSQVTVGFNSRLRPTPRPTNASVPSVPFERLAGKYRDPGYGTVELCLLSRHKAAIMSDSCRRLIDDLNTTLPDILDPQIPTFVTKWEFRLTHVSLTHFEHNVFNVSGFNSIPTGDSKDKPYWVRTLTDPNLVAEFSYDDGILGIGIRGLWGAGEGVDSPEGDTVKERAEVWFEKVE